MTTTKKAAAGARARLEGGMLDDRLGPGLLLLGGTDYGVQVSNVRLTPDVSSEDGTPTLGVPEPAPLTTVAWSLQGSAVQDFTDVDGFVNYCMDHALDEVAFSWTPNSDHAIEYKGTCQIVPVEIGGDVGVQITTDFSFAVLGSPERDDSRRAPAA